MQNSKLQLKIKRFKFKTAIFNFKPLTLYLTKGFTLVEMIIYIGLMSIFIVILTEIFISILNVRLETEATSSVDQDGRFILGRLEYDIFRASDINVTSPTSLNLTIGGNTYTYSLNGGNIQLVDNLGTNNLNGSESSLSSLSFQEIYNSLVPNSKETVKIQFTLNSRVIKNTGVESRLFQTTIGRR